MRREMYIGVYDVDTWVLGNLLQVIFQERVMKRRQAEYDRLRAQREEQIRQELQARKQEREILRKRKFFLIEEQKRREREAREAEAHRIAGTHARNIYWFLCLSFHYNINE